MEARKLLKNIAVVGVCSCLLLGYEQTNTLLAASQDTTVCDDNACWKVTVTVADNMQLYCGNSKKLRPTVTKEKGIQFVFESKDSEIAAVSANGKIEGKKAGSTVIKTTVKGKHVQKQITFETKVTVKNPSITITGKKKVKVGKTITLKVKKYGTKEEVKWSVNKKSIATIGKSNGKLKGLKKGKVKVTATCGELKKSVKIQVK